MSLEGQNEKPSLWGLMSALTSCGRAAARGYVREGRVEDGAVAALVDAAWESSWD
jgi:hypothetical protein